MSSAGLESRGSKEQRRSSNSKQRAEYGDFTAGGESMAEARLCFKDRARCGSSCRFLWCTLAAAPSVT